MHNSCPLCGEEGIRAVCNDRGRTIYGCASCRAAHVRPMPSRAEAAAAVRRSASLRLPREQDEEVRRLISARNNGILDAMEKRRPPGDLLDVGCGRGLFLEDARRRGWRVTGVEAAAAVAEEGMRKRSLEICVGAFPEVRLADESFDAVTFSHSLEHLDDPAAALGAARRALRRGGWIYVETPNWLSLSRRLLGGRWWQIDPENHLFYFSPQSLRRLCARAGLVAGELKGTHFDAAAFMIRLWHFRGREYQDLAVINDSRDRLLRVRGTYRLLVWADALFRFLLREGHLNDYLVFWMRKP